MQLILAIPAKLLRVAAIMAVLVVVVFFGLTRTEVGRDTLRQQLEHQFERSFDGTLSIGRLQGNLVSDLFASDVRIRDASGRDVLAVDSVVIRPHWRDLLRRSFSSGRISLYRPVFRVSFEEDGPNVARIFRRAEREFEESTPWSFRSADVRIVDGSILTTNDGFRSAAIDRGDVFDFTNARLVGLNARAMVDASGDATLLNLRSLTGSLRTPDVEIERLEGDFAFDAGRLSATDVEFRAGGSEGTLQAVLPRTKGLDAPELQIALTDATIDNESLRLIVPRLPLHDRAQIELRVRGPVDGLVIEQLQVERGQSVLQASGTLIGLPDSLNYEVAVDGSRLLSEDVEALLPHIDADIIRRGGLVRLDGNASGLVTQDPAGLSFSSDGRFRASSRSGTLEGPFTVGRVAGEALMVRGNLRTNRLRLTDLLEGVPERTELTGRVRFDGTHDSLDGLRGSLIAALAESRIGGHHVDSLRTNVEVVGATISGTARAYDAYASARLAGVYDAAAPLPTFRGDLAVRNFDAGGWWLDGDSVRTALHAGLSIEASGRSLGDLSFDIHAVIDSSTIWHGTRLGRIPRHEHTVRLSRDDSGATLSIGGDVLVADIHADAGLDAVIASINAWQPAVDDAIRAERAKRYRFRDSLDVAVERGEIDPTPLRPIQLTAEGQVRDARILSAVYAGLSDLSTDASFTASIDFGDSLNVRGRLEAGSLTTRGMHANAIELDVDLTGSRLHRLARSIDGTVDLRTGSINAYGQGFSSLSFAGRLSEGQGHFELETLGDDRGERLRGVAMLEMRAFRNRLRLQSLEISADAYDWALVSPPTIELYADAIVFPSVVMASHSAHTDEMQRIRVDGVLSSDARDTLYAHIEELRLLDISDMLSLRDPIGGVVNAEVALTGVLTRPELTGMIEVERLSLDDHPLGHLVVRSQYVPGQPDIALEAALTPLREDEFARPAEGIPAGATLNQVNIAGSFRLPQPGADRLTRDPGRLDLALEADYADAFFFDYIFRTQIEDAGGALSGSGAIRGDFRRPIFEASVQLADGRVRIPRFNLSYEVEGDATVDADGIHLHGVRVSDATGGTGIVNGGILFNDYRFFSFDLDARLDRTQFMNVPSARDLGFYGDVRASGDVTLTGPIDQAHLQSSNAVIHPDSRVYIAIQEEGVARDAGFIIFADSTGNVPDIRIISERPNVLSRRPTGERMFVEGVDMDLNILAPQGTNIHLVIDPVLGDVINATGTGRIQLQRTEGDFYTYGTLTVDAGDYLFTAGDVFVRRFLLDGGTITWDGDPANAEMNIEASYRTRASAAGLNAAVSERARIPLIVRLHITGRVSAPAVDLRLLIDHNDREAITAYESLESVLNQPERSAEYATSVMLTNSFLLTTNLASGGEVALSATRNQLAFHSLSQLVATQLNRYLSHTLPNLDVNLGFLGESTQDLDVTYGVALRLLDERLIIRGQGLYQNEAQRSAQQNLLDEFVVEVRMSNSVSVEVFYRREGDILGSDQTLANTTGAGLSYETQFTSWSRLFDRLFGWMRPREEPAAADDDDDVIAGAETKPPEAAGGRQAER